MRLRDFQGEGESVRASVPTACAVYGKMAPQSTPEALGPPAAFLFCPINIGRGAHHHPSHQAFAIHCPVPCSSAGC